MKRRRFRKDQDGNFKRVYKESIRDALKRFAKKEKIFAKQEIKEQNNIQAIWKTIVGDLIFENTNVFCKTKGILTVESNNSVILQELKMLGEQHIIGVYKSQAKPILFRKIVFKLKL